jgi:hypothetical protein
MEEHLPRRIQYPRIDLARVLARRPTGSRGEACGNAFVDRGGWALRHCLHVRKIGRSADGCELLSVVIVSGKVWNGTFPFR